MTSAPGFVDGVMRVKYAVLTRATQIWGDVSVKDIEPIAYDERVWDRLVLDPDTKVRLATFIASKPTAC